MLNRKYQANVARAPHSLDLTPSHSIRLLNIQQKVSDHENDALISVNAGTRGMCAQSLLQRECKKKMMSRGICHLPLIELRLHSSLPNQPQASSR